MEKEIKKEKQEEQNYLLLEDGTRIVTEEQNYLIEE
jgi:uncharacterized protein YacL